MEKHLGNRESGTDLVQNSQHCSKAQSDCLTQGYRQVLPRSGTWAGALMAEMLWVGEVRILGMHIKISPHSTPSILCPQRPRAELWIHKRPLMLESGAKNELLKEPSEPGSICGDKGIVDTLG